MAKKETEIEVVLSDEDDETFETFAESSEGSDKKKLDNGVSFEVDVYNDGKITSEYERGKPETAPKSDDSPVEVELETEVEETEDKEEVEKVEAPAPAKSKPEPKKEGESANKRIRELAREKNQYRAEVEKLQKAVTDRELAFAKLELARTEKEIEQQKQALKQAAESGDAEALASATIALQEALATQKELKGYVPAQEEEKKPQANDLPAAAQDWSAGKEFLVDNNAYKSLSSEHRKKLYPVRVELARVAEQLIREGYSTADYDFYEELDLRLTTKFDFYEGLASEGLDALNSKSKEVVSDDTSPGAGVKEPQKRTASEKTKSVPVKGPSSTGSASSSSSSKKIRVPLSKEDMRWYENHVKHHGVTLQEYAMSVMEERKKNR